MDGYRYFSAFFCCLDSLVKLCNVHANAQTKVGFQFIKTGDLLISLIFIYYYLFCNCSGNGVTKLKNVRQGKKHSHMIRQVLKEVPAQPTI